MVATSTLATTGIRDEHRGVGNSLIGRWFDVEISFAFEVYFNHEDFFWKPYIARVARVLMAVLVFSFT